MNLKITTFPLLVLLVACETGSPESAARRLADKRCACLTSRWSNDRADEEAVLDAAKANPDLDEADVEALRRERDKESGERDRACFKELSEMQKRTDIDFPREEDRQTIGNLCNSLDEQCEGRPILKEAMRLKTKVDSLVWARKRRDNKRE